MSANVKGFRQAVRRLRRRYPLFALLAVNLLAGIVIAGIAVSGLLLLDAHGLRGLVLRDKAPVAALLLLSFGFVITFGSLLMGSAIMRLSSEKPETRENRGDDDPSEPLWVSVRGE